MALYDGTNAPLIKVYLDTGNRTSGLFTLSWSALGGSDVLGSYTPFTTLTQLPTTDAKRITIRRGRTREDQQIQPGTLTLTMDNNSISRIAATKGEIIRPSIPAPGVRENDR